MTDADLPGWRRLGCAILLRAYRDAREGNGHSQEAWQFLAGDGARRLVAWLELDAAGLAVVLQDLPDPPLCTAAPDPATAGTRKGAAPPSARWPSCTAGELLSNTRQATSPAAAGRACPGGDPIGQAAHGGRHLINEVGPW